MTFTKLGYNRRLLDYMTKRAGFVGRAATWPIRRAWKTSTKTLGPIMGPVALGLGTLGAGAVIKSGINKSRAYRAGFDPRIQP